MKRLQQNALLVGLVALALGACSSTKNDMASQSTSPAPIAESAVSASSQSAEAGSSTRSDMASQTTSPPPIASEPMAPVTAGNQPADASTASAASSMPGGSAATAGTTSMPDQTGYTPSPATAAANSIVTLIEVVPRQQANMPGSDTSGSGTSGSGASGSTAAGGNDKVYRVTLHMDDGSTRVITQEVMPTFRAGDRVRLENGMVLR